jgi:hypothetical protein
MLHEHKNSPWQEIRDKGYLHIRKFLTEPELQLLQNNWLERSKAAKGSANDNYPIVDIWQMIVWRFHRKIKNVTDAIYSETGIRADVDAGAEYFATEKGVNFGWHQEHDPYFVYQQLFEYLNFYIPILKPDAKLTNLCLVPMDELQARLPGHFEKFVGLGAKRFHPDGNETLVCDEDDGSEYILPVNIEELKVTPELGPGDLLLFRGDVIHRTQDTETKRVAASFRRTSSTAIISRAKLQAGCLKKKMMMQKYWELYRSLFECFEELKQAEITALQFSLHLTKRASTGSHLAGQKN